MTTMPLRLNERTVERLNRQAAEESDAERVARQREAFDRLQAVLARRETDLPPLQAAREKAVGKVQRAKAALLQAEKEYREADGLMRQAEFRATNTRDRLKLLVQRESPECLNKFIGELAVLQDRARNSFAAGVELTGRWNPINGPEKTRISNGDRIAAYVSRCKAAWEQIEAAMLVPMTGSDAETLVANLLAEIGEL
jgi:hypothetical protein